MSMINTTYRNVAQTFYNCLFFSVKNKGNIWKYADRSVCVCVCMRVYVFMHTYICVKNGSESVIYPW